ncbi:MAG: Cytochrome c [Chthoniobacteraceae bacterium]|nr:Cytochrome c [Chthoniobacteraceae bacterium]
MANPFTQHLSRLCRAGMFWIALLPLISHVQADFPEPTNTEPRKTMPLSAAEAVTKWQLPEGFEASVFAAEPDVRQPIAICLDDRGRLWVAESYTYAGAGGGYYDLKLRDRIVILEDTDGDGRHDKRTVFCDNLERLTSIEVGFGGVWALTVPNLVFIPDKNHDDQPDAQPQIVLDGFDYTRAAHTMANGLRWGPDGWLYGRQGILGSSMIGLPGAAETARTRMGPGVWRYHPKRGTVEVVCEGTTNPWGMDWNEYGEAFFINTVIGHLWHVIPGAHYVRMFGQDNNPHAYRLIDQHADHVHWDTREIWSDVRKIGVTAASSSAGGGHAHTGLMIYLGDNWPENYRGELFTINYHGRRLNRETLERTGGGYTGRRAPDLAQSADDWFRGIDLIYGPDGGVFLSDWSDTGECHDDDGMHRQSGRIYKITHGRPSKPVIADVGALTTSELPPLLTHKNEWFARHARRQLQERAGAGEEMGGVAAALVKQFAESGDKVHQLRALWSLHAIGRADAPFLRTQLVHSNEYVRAWAIRLLLDDKAAVDVETVAALTQCAKVESSAFVRLALASALQRMPLDARAAMAGPLLGHAEDAADHDLPLMLWYGIEPLAQSHPMELAKLGESSLFSATRTCIARRLTEDLNDPSGALSALLGHAATAPKEWQIDLLAGMSEALQGLRQAKPPAAWAALSTVLAKSQDPEVRNRYRTLGGIFGDASAIAAHREIALDGKASIEARRAALRSAIEARAEGLRALCETLFGASGLTSTAAAGLALNDDPATADFMIERFASTSDKPAVIGALLTRPAWVARLLDAVDAKKISAKELSAFNVRQIRGFKNADLTARVTTLWGEVHDSSADKLALIAKWKDYLTPAVLAQGDKTAGRALFTQTCGTCHKMYGQGGNVGPELTGGGRDNLEYLLGNIADPSAVVAKDYQLSILIMKDGRVLTGMIRGRDDRVLTLQTLTESVTVPDGDISQTQTIPTSLMPEGLLEALTPVQVRDLFAWLMDKNPPPAAPAAPGTARISLDGDWRIKVSLSDPASETTLDVAPPVHTVVTAEHFASIPLYNVEGGGWNNGAHLAGNIAEVCSTPDLIDIPTVTLRSGADPESHVFVRGKDWEIENSWGTFGRLPNGEIGEATPVFVSYGHTHLRQDSIVLGVDGKISLRQGAGAPAAPRAPSIAEGEKRLGTVWITGPMLKLTEDNLFPILETAYPKPSEPSHAAEKTLPHFMAKLRAGLPVRILAWGDSVTECVYLPHPERWQEQFASRLQAAFPQAKIELLTEGWGGRSTANYLKEPAGSSRNYQEKVLNLKPDLIISEFVNDAGLSSETVKSQYGRILADFQAIGAEWIILTPHYVRPAWMSLSREREIDADPRPYTAALRQFAAEHPVTLADASVRFGRLWRQGIPYTTLLVNSVNHPNAEGMKIFAETLIALFD